MPSASFRYKQGNLMIGLTMRNATTKGITSAQITGVRSTVSDTKLSMEVDVNFPQILTEAYYKGQGSINALQVKSKGFVNVTYSKLLLSVPCRH